MQVFGDEKLAQEVMAFLREWDDAIARLDIQDIVQLCRPEIRLVDVSMEVKGVEAYRHSGNNIGTLCPKEYVSNAKTLIFMSLLIWL